MLHEGKIIEAGSSGEVMQTHNPIVRQFMSGGLEG
jgi:ABC-type transporter Mla maintaining outer membrane lipid asymmetry ATPase subunit MlaF